VIETSASMLNGQAAEGRFFTASLPSHAMIGVLVNVIPGVRPLARKGERGPDSQDRMDQASMIAPKG
jgi:hypothetical protein